MVIQATLLNMIRFTISFTLVQDWTLNLHLGPIHDPACLSFPRRRGIGYRTTGSEAHPHPPLAKESPVCLLSIAQVTSCGTHERWHQHPSRTPLALWSQVERPRVWVGGDLAGCTDPEKFHTMFSFSTLTLRSINSEVRLSCTKYRRKNRAKQSPASFLNRCMN